MSSSHEEIFLRSASPENIVEAGLRILTKQSITRILEQSEATCLFCLFVHELKLEADYMGELAKSALDMKKLL